jgi:hypothetical protein
MAKQARPVLSVAFGLAVRYGRGGQEPGARDNQAGEAALAGDGADGPQVDAVRAAVRGWRRVPGIPGPPPTVGWSRSSRYDPSESAASRSEPRPPIRRTVVQGVCEHHVMDVDVLGAERLRFRDGAPVRAASAVVPFGDGHLVVSDDATHAAWFRAGTATPVRLLPPIGGDDVFDEASGTKQLKPDLEAACQVMVYGAPAALVLGSGSSPARMRWCLLRLEHGRPRAVVADMTSVYATVAAALSVDLDLLNLEGACIVGNTLQWFHRGLPSAGLASGSVDIDVRAALAVTLGEGDVTEVRAARPVHYDLGAVDGVGLAITDVVALPGGDLIASAAAEDSPNPRDDGPVVASALARIRGDRVVTVVPLPKLDGRVIKVEGLMVLDTDEEQTTLFAVTDVDDPDAASWATRLRVRH